MAQADPWSDEQIDPELAARITKNNTGVTGGTGVDRMPEILPTGSFDRQKFRDAWMSGSGSLDDFVKNNSSFASGVSVNKDRATLPTGEVLDLVGDIGGRNSHEWTGTGYNAQGVADQGGGGTPSSFSGGGGGGVPQGSEFQQQVRAQLMAQLGQLSQPVTGQDPAISGVNQAYRVARERSAQQERGAAAERAAFSGLNSGGQGSGSYDSAAQGIQEQAGQDIAGHDAGVVMQEVQQRRGALQNLLQMALQTGDAESARALQLQIAQMDNQLRQSQLAQQGSQFNAQLGQNQSQFNDQFGYRQSRDYSDDQYRNAVLLAMGGQ